MASNQPVPGSLPGSNVFTQGAYLQPLFTVPPLFTSSRDTSTIVDSQAATFTADDRMMLKMVYHQQQAMQVQLNAIVSWMQHINGVVSTMERRSREQPGSPLLASGVAKAEPSPPLPATSHASAVVVDPVGAVRQQGNTSRASNAVTSRSCTPPRDETNASLNRSIESVAAPWDPSNKLPASTGSARSSRGSQLGRSDNPLLSSLHSAVKLRQVSTLAASKPPSRTGSVIASTWDGARPASVAAGCGASTTLSIESGEDFSSRPKPFIAPRSAPLRGGGLHSEREIPPYRGLSSVPTSHADPASSRLQSQAPPPVSTKKDEGLSSEARSGSTGSHRTHVYQDRAPRIGDTLAVYDSLSDGYGSYESRQYMKDIGLL